MSGRERAADSVRESPTTAHASGSRRRALLLDALQAARAAACRIVVDPFSIEWIDPAIEAATGIEAATWCRPNFWNVHLHPDDRPSLEQARMTAMRGRPISVRVRVRGGGGPYLFVALCGRPAGRAPKPPTAIDAYLVLDPLPLVRSSHERATGAADVTPDVGSTAPTASESGRTWVGELGGDVVHDLRQPLAALEVNLGAATQLLRRTSPAIDEALDAVQDALADARRLHQNLQILDDLVARREPRRERPLLDEIAAETPSPPEDRRTDD